MSSNIMSRLQLGSTRSFQDWRREKTTPTILVVGNTGTGKSALINGMIGEKVAAEAALEKGTTRVRAYIHPDNGVRFWETPGLHGGGVGEDVKNISNMKSEGCADADIVFYCVKMTVRFQQEDQETIKNLTEGLGKRIWKNVVIVLTFANDVVAHLNRQHKRRPGKKSVHHIFKDLVKGWKKALVDAVGSAGVDSEIAKCIPVIPAGYAIEKLFPNDDDNWVESLWYTKRGAKMQDPSAYSDVQASILSGMFA